MGEVRPAPRHLRRRQLRRVGDSGIDNIAVAAKIQIQGGVREPIIDYESGAADGQFWAIRVSPYTCTMRAVYCT